MVSHLYERFNDYVKRNSLLTHDENILVAVSGGVDSMVLLALMVRSGYKVAVAHCNFQLRGRESDEDELLVEKAAKKYGIPFYNKKFDTAGEMERTGESVQIAARRLRYAWFDELSREHDYKAVAIAHHADDSIETFFINMFRGTGLRGLTGISVVNGHVVRPLLFASRKEILEYAVANNIDFREDSSNSSTKYLRNKIRIGLIPRIREINPHFNEIMVPNVQRLTNAQHFIDGCMQQIRSVVESRRDNLVVIDPSKVDRSLPLSFVLYELLTPYGFKGDVVDSLYTSLEAGGSGKRFYAKEYVAYLDRGLILIAEIDDSDTCTIYIDKGRRRVYCGNSVYYFEHLDIDNIETLSQPDNIALLDADKLKFPLLARKWQEGDWFIPLGMTGRKKISDYLIDAKVSLPEKQRQFVFLSGDEVIWLAGRRIDDRYKVSASTENVLKIIKEVL